MKDYCLIDQHNNNNNNMQRVKGLRILYNWMEISWWKILWTESQCVKKSKIIYIQFEKKRKGVIRNNLPDWLRDWETERKEWAFQFKAFLSFVAQIFCWMLQQKKKDKAPAFLCLAGCFRWLREISLVFLASISIFFQTYFKRNIYFG